MIQCCCEILLKKFRGKEIRPGKSGDTVNRGTVNRGFTVVEGLKNKQTSVMSVIPYSAKEGQ